MAFLRRRVANLLLAAVAEAGRRSTKLFVTGNGVPSV